MQGYSFQNPNIASIRRRLLPRLKSAEQLQKDCALEEQGVDFHFAVDFSVLYLYAYPTSEMSVEFTNELGADPEEKAVADQLARQRIALTEGLLSSIPLPLILLPPYIRELQSHVNWSATAYI